LRGEATRNAQLQSAMSAPRNPWGWATEARLTYALKVLALIAIGLYLGGIAIGFVGRIGSLLYILIGAVFLAYLVYPLVEWMRQRRVPKVVAILLVYAAIGVFLSLVGALVVPHVVREVNALVRLAPHESAVASNFINDPSNRVLSRVPPWLRGELLALPSQATGWLRAHGIAAAGQAFGVVLGTFATIATFVIIPVLAAYMLLDLEHLNEALLRVLPHARRGDAVDIISDIDHVVGGFIRGQLLVALSVGVLLTIVLLVMRVPFAFLLGLLAALGDLVPYVGAVLTFIPAVLIAVIHNGWINAVIVGGLFVVVYQVEGHFISPAVMSNQLKLSPFVILLAILIGAELGGVVGMLVAVPIAGILRVILVRASNQESP
jgi:predicted PurR-regulated permease PerM